MRPRVVNLHPFKEDVEVSVGDTPLPDSTELEALGDWGAAGEEDRGEGGSVECDWGMSGLVGGGGAVGAGVESEVIA